ncbi:MAG: penicillin-binding protein 2 [Chloroflexi bacterium]|nr:penicillin-binding protein 2 [Chloroflexota bacterium]OJV92503.1 MAG: penicillin-binding protein 2 [Chloroflexi bacterium 54-19]
MKEQFNRHSKENSNHRNDISPLHQTNPDHPLNSKWSRRKFLQATGLTVIAVGASGILVACGEEPTATSAPGTTAATTANGQIIPGMNTTATAAGTTQAASASTAAATTAAPTTAAATTAAPTTAAPSPTAAVVGNPLDTAKLFLNDWAADKYSDMYGMLTVGAKSTIAQDAFVNRYNAIKAEATINTVKIEVGKVTPPTGTQTSFPVPFKATYNTSRVGQFSEDNQLNLVIENGTWKVDWTPAAIFKELTNTTYLVRMVPTESDRGNIVTRDNAPLTGPIKQYQVYVVPGQIKDETNLLGVLSTNLAMDPNDIKNLYKDGQPDWRMPIKNLPGTYAADKITAMKAVPGVGVDETSVRGYPQSYSASQVVGYVAAINADELKDMAAKGYTDTDVIGKAGVELWGEETLAGTFGGKLTVIQRDGGTVATMAEKPAGPSANLILNLDMKIQKVAEQALGARNGSIVVMDPSNGAVLALANFPGYDPNVFVNGLTDAQYKVLNDDPRAPFKNRAVNGQLPVGSTFKAITTAAALEKAGVNMDATFNCTGHWTGLGEANAKDCYLKTGHGKITLHEALVQSCDFVYYELGKRLNEIDPNIIPTFAKGFGLGSSTGMLGLYDSAGQVPSPDWKQANLSQPWVPGDGVNLAIGQGYLLASPLQMAVVYSSLAMSGTIPVPRVVDRAESTDAAASKTYPAATKGKLPVSDANIQLIRQALLGVTQESLGTARNYFSGYRVPVAGKTGTAESGVEDPHAWFCCYAPATNPKYVVVVCLENAGFSTETAVPAARKVMDALTF